jgi:hypothetical protein
MIGSGFSGAWLADCGPEFHCDEEGDLGDDCWVGAGGSIDCEPEGDAYRGEDCAGVHPVSCEHDEGYEAEADSAGVLFDFGGWAVDVADHGDRADDVNPAEDGAFGGGFHGWSYSCVRAADFPTRVVVSLVSIPVQP